jgi:MFS family permease
MEQRHKQTQTKSPGMTSDVEKTARAVVTDADMQSSDSDDAVDRNAQAGVQDIQALTSVWSRKTLIIAYVMLWFIYFVNYIQQGATGALTPWVTSAFQEHSLTPTANIMSSIISGVLKLTTAKILDVFGRPHGYLLSIVFAVVGLIMMAACKSVEMYAAAQVFFTVGNNAMLYTLSVFIADTSSLRNRGLMAAFVSSPNFITTWLGGPISEAYLKGPGWSWCFGTFSIVTPATTLPLLVLFVHNYRKAQKQGLIPARNGARTPWQSFVYYCREFDAVGLLLLSGGLALFLLPFHIYSLQTDGWKSTIVICLLVFGLVLIAAFAYWEKYFAPITFIPYALLLDRTVLGACILSATLFVSYFCWSSYFTSFLQVVSGLSVTEASYVAQAYTIGSCLFSIGVGLLIHCTGRFKPISLYFAVPMSILGMGLMINFRQPDTHVGYIIMCQILISFAAGTVIICGQVAAMAVASHEHLAVVLAVEAMFAEVGGAIGLTVAAAIWQGVFAVKLAEYLPASELPNLPSIYAELPVQLSYSIGSPARLAIQHAYGDAQKMMLIAGTAVWVVGFIATLMWRDINVIGMKQVKGRIV